jgi:hypothetical protein
MEQGFEYSYDELDTLQKDSAIASIYQSLRDDLGFSFKTHSAEIPLLECIIKKLEPIFDEFGMIAKISKKYEKVTIETVEEIYDECKKARK